MALESASRRKFTQLVANHVLIDQNRDVLTAVVDGDCQPTISGEIIERRDQVLIGRRSLLSIAVSTFFHQVKVYKRTFLQ